ncbi:conserved exported hypothetical protein [Vibrio jasicida]|nr:conserved exported hypothetical protein [Vibrio jasicida]
MINIYSRKISMFYCVLTIFSSLSNASVPEGFEELVMARKEKLELNIYSDEHHSIFGEFIVEGDTFKLTNSSSIDPSLLINLGLNKEGALLAYKKLLKGSSTSKQCKGFREECIITPQNIDFVYIDDKKKLTLFVSPEFMSPLLNSEKSFITPEIDEKALIINNSISYSGVSNEDNSYQDNYSYYNESYLGLGNDSYLRSDFNLGTSNGLSFDDLSYNHISGQNKYKIGYQSSNQYWNATDTLESFNNFSSYIFSTGSTNDLRVLKEEDYERFYFSSPRSGRLEVKNDQGRILISKNINNGPQYISYYDLPKGTYNVSIKVFDGDNVIFEENKLIINKNNFSAKVGELDYKISLGYLSDEFVNTSLDNNNEYEDYQAPFFSDGRLMTRVFDTLSIGGGVLATSIDYYVYVGMDYQITEQASLLFNGGIFNDKDAFLLTQLRWHGFSLSWRKFTEGDDNSDVNLSDLLFYNDDYENVNINYSYNINNDNSFYLSAVYSDFSVEDSAFITSTTTTTSFKLGYTRYNLPLNSQLNVDLGMSESDDSDPQYDVGLTINIPFGASHTYSHNSYYNMSSKEASHRDNINSYWLNDADNTLSTNAGLYYSSDKSSPTSVDISASYATNGDEIKSSSYLYANSDGTISGNVFLESNAIITKNDGFLTTKKSDSYFVAKNRTGRINADGKFSSVIQEYVNDEAGRTILLDNELEVHALKSYKKYSFNVDQYSSDFFNDGESNVEATSFPGTLIRLDTSVGELKSFISTFVDIKGELIDSVECVGRGCVQTERLVEGVYQFKVKKSLPYKIISRKEQCVIPSLDNSDSRNLGENFCMPSFEDSYSDYQLAKFSDNDYYYFIGKFTDDSIVETYKKKFMKSGVVFVERKVDGFSYIFINSERLLVKNELNDVNEMMSFALENNLEPYVSN